jgi:hypothetical protein
MTEPKPRYGTANAINKLAKELNLVNKNNMQDWEWEVAEAKDIEKYLLHYNSLIDEDEKFVLMEIIIQATTNQKEPDFIKYVSQVISLLQENFNLHEYSIFYWSCFDSEELNDCWEISPFMREIWLRNRN